MRVFIYISCLIVVAYGNGEPGIKRIIDFTLAARNLPSGKNPFAEIKSPIYCRTETQNGSQNPRYGTTCSVTHDQSRELNFDIRHDRSGARDQSIGWARVHTGDMLVVGKTVEAQILDGNTMVGVFMVTTTRSLLATDELAVNGSTVDKN